MGSQSSQHRLGSFSKRLEYDELIKYVKYDGQQGQLQIHGMIITQNKFATVFHHGFCFDIPQNEYYIFFEWGGSGHDIYKSKAKLQHFQKSLGRINFKSFKEAWAQKWMIYKNQLLNYQGGYLNIFKQTEQTQFISFLLITLILIHLS